MTGLFSDPALWTGVLIALAVLLGCARLILWRRSAPSAERTPRGRLASLIFLQALAGGLMWLTLNPPTSLIRTGTMIVATAESPATVATSPGDILIALPESGPILGAERAPDLATALRRHPIPARIRILGRGLTPRDQAPLPVPVTFAPPLVPRGLTDLALPEPALPGETFVVGGQIGALAASTVEMVDPADQIVSKASVTAGQRFALMSSTRTSGLALFELRLRDAAGALVEQIAIPVETVEPSSPRVLVLAGAPGAETKFLQRWAEDAGVAMTIDIDVGGGVRLGDPPVALTRASLSDLDLVVIDDRRWESLGASGRAALSGAVNEGLGLLLRPSGPLSPATRRDWAGLGAALSGGDEAVALRLNPPGETPADPSEGSPSEDLPELTRRDLTDEGASAVTLLRDGDGVALASWRARGRGRVGVWTVTDSYALVLIGRPERYGEMWSALFTEIGRAGDDSRALVEGLPRVGVRTVLCRLTGEAQVVGRDGKAHELRIDPATGGRDCAAFWPQEAGWHLIRDGEDRQTPFYVQPADAAPSLIAAADRSATLALAGTAPTRAAPASTSRAPGSAWPWFGGLLVVLSVLWWLERNRTFGGLASLRARIKRS